jgi:hypothetical protein
MSVVNVERPQGRDEVGRLKRPVASLAEDERLAIGEAVREADAGRLRPRLSRQEAIGNWMDPRVRRALRQMFDDYQISYGPRADVIINNRDYENCTRGSPTTGRRSERSATMN